MKAAFVILSKEVAETCWSEHSEQLDLEFLSSHVSSFCLQRFVTRHGIIYLVA